MEFYSAALGTITVLTLALIFEKRINDTDEPQPAERGTIVIAGAALAALGGGAAVDVLAHGRSETVHAILTSAALAGLAIVVVLLATFSPLEAWLEGTYPRATRERRRRWFGGLALLLALIALGAAIFWASGIPDVKGHA